jgi:DNA adenine methylase
MASLSPLRYPGGKFKTYNYVKHLVQQNNLTTYIEPFAGGAAVALSLLFNGDVRKIIINDIDPGIYLLWRTIITDPAELIQMINDTPITPEEWRNQKEIYAQGIDGGELRLAFATLFLNRTCFSGIIKAGMLGGESQEKNTVDCRFNKQDIINRIENIYALRNQIQVYNLDAKDFIKNVIKKTRMSLTFFDPPYYIKGPDLYTNFYSHQDHVELAKIIKKTMRNRYWILTYDIAKQIEKLYKRYDYKKYNLNYSIAKSTKGQEFIFFSKKIEIGQIENHLNLCDPIL